MKLVAACNCILLIVTFSYIAFGQESKGVVSIEVDERTLVLHCPVGVAGRLGPSKDFVVDVRVNSSKRLRGSKIRYEVAYGKIYGYGDRVQWDLINQQPGTYWITASQILNGRVIGHRKAVHVTIVNDECANDCFCAQLDVVGPSQEVKDGEIHYFTAKVSGGPDVTYNWSIETGEIISGQGTPELVVRVKKTRQGQKVIATVEIGGQEPACGCPTKKSASVSIID